MPKPRYSTFGLLGRIINQPLIATPDVARFYFSYLADRRDMDAVIVEDGVATPTRDIVAVGKYGYGASGVLPTVPDTGIAVIEVSGALTHKLGAIDPYSGMTGYDGLEFKAEAAMADPAIKGVLLDIHSPGGEVSGGFAAAAKIAQLAKQKPVWAIANEHAFSGAYLIASQAQRITAPRTGGVGSIGVIMVHKEASRLLANQGVTVTIIKAGAKKADMNSFEPLSDAAIAKLQAEIDDIYGMFVDAVAQGREMDANAVRATAADIFTAPDALALGLIDAVQPADDTIAEFAAVLNQPNTIFSFAPASPTAAGIKSAAAEHKELEMEKPGSPAPAASAAAPALAAAAPAADTATAERERVLAIQAMSRPGEEALANRLIAEGASIGVATKAFTLDREEAAQARALTRRAEAPRPVAASSAGNAGLDLSALPLDQRCKAEWDSDPALRAEFFGNYEDFCAYRKAEESGRLRNMGAFKKGAGQPLPGATA